MRKIVLLVFFVVLAFVIRAHNINNFLFFDYEQGRDALVVKNIYTLKNLTLIGPKTDIDGLFHGPLYYYLLAIPYFVSGGNPLAASLFIIALCSLVPLVVYKFSDDFLPAVISIFSFELVVYSRWLSNVSLATLFGPLAFLFLWRYIQKQKVTDFFLSTIFVAIACQFEIILAMEFAFVFIVLILFKVLKIPSLKTLLVSGVAVVIVFAPLIFFDLRHQNIMIASLITSLGAKTGSVDPQSYFSDLFKIIGDNIGVPLILIPAVILLFKKLPRFQVLFLLTWCFMSLPVIIFDKGEFYQLFVGSGIGWIILFSLVANTLWKIKKLKYLTILLFIPLIFSWGNTLKLITLNKGAFFNRAQEGVDYKTQTDIITFMHDDAKGQPYRFEAFTVPYLHPEGWKYLQSYFYPNDNDRDSKLFYIAIEKQIPPFWEKQWISDLGNPTFLKEKQFGLIRLSTFSLAKK